MSLHKKGTGLTIILIISVVMSHAHADSTFFPAAGETLLLGRGLNGDFGRLARTCVSGSALRSSGARGELTMEISSGTESELRDAGAAASGEANLGLVGASHSVEFFSRISSRSLQDSLVVRYEIEGAPWLLSLDAKPNAEGESASAGDAKSRLSLCGNEFVRQIDVGYRLWIALSFQFDTAETQEYYNKTSTRSALFGAVKKKSTDIRRIEDFSESAVFSVSVLQDGGDSRPLKALLAKGSTRCLARNIKDCLATVDSVLAFTSAAKGKGGFRDQLSESDSLDANDERRPAIFRAHTASYASAGLMALEAPSLSDAERSAYRELRASLALHIKRAYATLARLDAVIAAQGGGRFSQPTQQDIRAAELNLAALRTAEKTCVATSHVSACAQAANEAFAAIQMRTPD